MGERASYRRWTAEDCCAQLRCIGAKAYLDSKGQLRIRPPKGKDLSPDARRVIKQMRSELVRFLRAEAKRIKWTDAKLSPGTFAG